MSESEDLVLLQRQGAVAHLTLNRPAAANALSLATLQRLRVLLAEVSADECVFVVQVTGAGDQAFCAGADLKERLDFSEEQVQEFVAEIRATMDDLAALPQPTVAYLNGATFGGGAEMALACDLRVMAPGAKFGLTETSLAIIPGAGGCIRLPRLVGAAKAKELILLARRVSAEEALRMGLVHAVGELEEAEAMVQALLRNGPLALRAAKAALDGGLGLPLAAALEHESECYKRILSTQDRVEALRAFSEKRPPRFRGK